jgi:hypothetical protein
VIENDRAPHTPILVFLLSLGFTLFAWPVPVFTHPFHHHHHHVARTTRRRRRKWDW